jgi:hypothetical protein
VLINHLTTLVFGYDVFISYPYADGKPYAEALEGQLNQLDFTCFIDKKELPYGEALTSSLQRAIIRSRVVILVGSRAALNAPYVNQEIAFALARRRAVIPIDIDGIRSIAPWPELKEVPWLEEAVSSAAEPSAAVLQGVGQHFRFRKRNSRTRRAISVMAVVFLVLAIIAGWQWRMAITQRQIAEHQTAVAVEQTGEANAQRVEAERQRNSADEQRREAERRRQEAEEATQRERDAKLRVLARQLSAKSGLLLSERPFDAQPAAILAAESLRLVPTLEGDRALRDALDRLPRRIASFTQPKAVRCVAFSPDRTLIVTCGDDHTARLFAVSSAAQIAQMRHRDVVVGATFSPDGRFVATASRDGAARVFSIPSGRLVVEAQHGGPVHAIAFSRA